MLLRGVAHKKAGSFRDIRPALTAFDQVDAVIVADFKAGGLYRVLTENRMHETRVIPNLHKPEAATMVKNLRARGYKAEYTEMALL